MKRMLPERVRLMLSAIRLGLDRYDDHGSRGLLEADNAVDWSEVAFDARLWSAQLDAVARLLDQMNQDIRARETPAEKRR